MLIPSEPDMEWEGVWELKNYVAWLAGLYEGEGCLHRKVDARGGHVSWELTISSTDRDVVERARAIMRVGTLNFCPRQRAHWQDQYRWRVGRRDDIAKVIVMIRPLLGNRRGERAHEFMRWWHGQQG